MIYHHFKLLLLATRRQAIICYTFIPVDNRDKLQTYTVINLIIYMRKAFSDVLDLAVDAFHKRRYIVNTARYLSLPPPLTPSLPPPLAPSLPPPLAPFISPHSIPSPSSQSYQLYSSFPSLILPPPFFLLW